MTADKNARPLAEGPGAEAKPKQLHQRRQSTAKPRRRQPIRSAIKSAIVGLAIRGLLPRRLARWLIQRGGLRHV